MSKSTTQGSASGTEQFIQSDIQTLIKDVQKLLSEIHERKISRTDFLLNLQSSQLHLVRPLPIAIHYDGVQVIASSSDLDMFGYGETEPEAIRDFCLTIVELYNSLKQEQGNLGPHTQQIWNFMQNIIKER